MRFAALLFVPLALLPLPVLAAAKYCDDTKPNVVVYVDRTTPYDDTDKKDLVDGVSSLFESLQGGERFALRTITESFSSSTELLDACIPFCPDGGLLGDLFGSCTEGVMINDRKHLRDQLVTQLKALLDNFVELPNSEIVRTIGLSAPQEFRVGRANRFYLFTDLIENSTYLPGRSFFGDKTDKLIAKVTADKLIPDLTGAVVRVFGVGRSGKPDRPPLEQKLLAKLTDFWQRYFAAAHAQVTIQQSLGEVD